MSGRILGIYGASGLGREVLELARIINKNETRWDGFAFIDDGSAAEEVSGVRVYRYDAAVSEFGKDLEVMIGIGEPETRRIKFEQLAADGIETPTLIHPDVHIPESTRVGKGVVIQYGCFISCDVVIEDHVFLQPQCNIGHDDRLLEGCMIAGFGNIGGLVTIGRYTYVGMSAAVRECVTIGDNSIVGMGSVVTGDIPEGLVVLGNPARPIARNTDKRVFRH